MQEVQITLQKGTVVRDRYTVEDLLGKGGFGAVYLVRDLRVKGNLFALKEVVNPNKEERDRFAFECQVLKRLDHHALPRVYRVFEDDKNIRAYMLMDYVEGPNLEFLRQQQPEKRFSVPQVLNIMAPIIDAVSYLHSQKPPIIHRDIKPANIIVPSGGDNAVLVDFGIAKEYDQESTTTAVRRCSPGYGAPEQYARGTNPRTDVYGLAATFYALLAGNVPTDALYRMTQLGSKGVDPVEPLNSVVPNVPLFIAGAIQHAMEINSNERFATAQEFWQALNAHPIQASLPEPITPLPETGPQTAEPFTDMAAAPTVGLYKKPEAAPARRRGILPILLALLVLVALIAGVLFGTGILSTTRHVGSASIGATATHTTKPTATHSVPTARPTATSPAQHSTPPAQPISPSSYPALNQGYTGIIYNQPAAVGDTMSLTRVQQNSANFTGYLSVGTNLQGSGNFTGTVSKDKKIQFLVAPFANHLPLLFQGQINTDGTLSGTYCSANGNQCDYNSGGGYGTWRVSAPSPSSLLPSQNGSYALADTLSFLDSDV